MNGGYRHPASISSIRILFLASIVLCLLTRSAVSVIIAINRRPVSAAVVVCVRVLFLLARMIISSGVARCLRVGVSLYDLGSRARFPASRCCCCRVASSVRLAHARRAICTRSFRSLLAALLCICCTL